MKKIWLLVAGCWLLAINMVYSQQIETADAKAERMQWFADAKLGIFIHWGI